MKLTQEQLAKAKAAKSAEELLALAKAEGVALTEEEAAKYFADLHKEGELADEELDNVAGGTCYSSGVVGPYGKTRAFAIVSPWNLCPYSNSTQACMTCDQSFTVNGTWYCAARWMTDDGEKFDTSYFGQTH